MFTVTMYAGPFPKEDRTGGPERISPDIHRPIVSPNPGEPVSSPQTVDPEAALLRRFRNCVYKVVHSEDSPEEKVAKVQSLLNDFFEENRLKMELMLQGYGVGK